MNDLPAEKTAIQAKKSSPKEVADEIRSLMRDFNADPSPTERWYKISALNILIDHSDVIIRALESVEYRRKR